MNKIYLGFRFLQFTQGHVRPMESIIHFTNNILTRRLQSCYFIIEIQNAIYLYL